MKDSRNILFLTSEFPPQPGGIGNHAYNLARELQKNGFNLTVLCDRRSINGEGEKVFDFGLSFSVNRIQRNNIIFFSYLQRIFQGFSLARQNDIVIASGKFSLWVGALLSIFYIKKYLAIIHGSEVGLPYKTARKMTDMSLKRYDKIVAVSNFTKALISHLKLNNITVIPNGFNMEPLQKSIIRLKGFPNLITVGNVTQRKGQHNVINALPLMVQKFPEVHYHIVGIPTEKEKLKKLALNLGVEDYITFHGKVTESEKQELLLNSDIFVMLSENTAFGDVEGFGIAILEANFLGIPAIGSKGCGIEDAIENGKSGILVDYKNKAEFVNAVTEILENRSEFSDNSKKWALNFKWDVIVLEYLKVMEDIYGFTIQKV